MGVEHALATTKLDYVGSNYYLLSDQRIRANGRGNFVAKDLDSMRRSLEFLFRMTSIGGVDASDYSPNDQGQVLLELNSENGLDRVTNRIVSDYYLIIDPINNGINGYSLWWTLPPYENVNLQRYLYRENGFFIPEGIRYCACFWKKQSEEGLGSFLSDGLGYGKDYLEQRKSDRHRVVYNYCEQIVAKNKVSDNFQALADIAIKYSTKTLEQDILDVLWLASRLFEEIKPFIDQARVSDPEEGIQLLLNYVISNADQPWFVKCFYGLYSLIQRNTVSDVQMYEEFKNIAPSDLMGTEIQVDIKYSHIKSYDGGHDLYFALDEPTEVECVLNPISLTRTYRFKNQPERNSISVDLQPRLIEGKLIEYERAQEDFLNRLKQWDRKYK